MIQLARRLVISQPIASVICKPQIGCFRMPVEAYRIADTLSNNFAIGSIRIDASDGGKNFIFWVTNIAGRTYRNIKFAIGTEVNEFPAVMAILRIAFGDNYRVGRIGKIGSDIIIPINGTYGSYI